MVVYPASSTSSGKPFLYVSNHQMSMATSTSAPRATTIAHRCDALSRCHMLVGGDDVAAGGSVEQFRHLLCVALEGVPLFDELACCLANLLPLLWGRAQDSVEALGKKGDVAGLAKPTRLAIGDQLRQAEDVRCQYRGFPRHRLEHGARQRLDVGSADQEVGKAVPAVDIGGDRNQLHPVAPAGGLDAFGEGERIGLVRAANEDEAGIWVPARDPPGNPSEGELGLSGVG